jgi:hypothetical protein
MTLLCALGALLLFGTLFWRGDAPGGRRISVPTTVERGDEGMLGAASWLQGEGVRTLSLRERFGALGAHRELSATGNLLIVTLPAASNFRNDEVVALDQWIRAGNTLLVLAALKDQPRWLPATFMMDNDLQLLTGLAVVREGERVPVRKGAQPPAGKSDAPSKSDAARKTDEAVAGLVRLTQELSVPQRQTLVPNRAHPYLEGVTKLVGVSAYVPREATLAVPRDGFALTLAHDSDNGHAGLWVRPDGAGTVIVSGLATLFTNRALGIADNARLLSNLVGSTLAPQGTVIFDDQHQGLTATYDPAKFYRDPRLYATLAVLALAWLVWVLGGTQLKMPLQNRKLPGEAQLVRTTGLFLARVLRPAAAARRMFDNFFQRLRVAPLQSRPDAAQLWEWLENHPQLARADVRQLQEWYAAACAERRVPLLRLHNLLLSTERQIAA